MKTNNLKKLVIIIMAILLTFSVIINVITLARLAPFENGQTVTSFYNGNKDKLMDFINLCIQNGICYIVLYEDDYTKCNIHNMIGGFYIYSFSELNENIKTSLNSVLIDLKHQGLSHVYVDNDGALFVFGYGLITVGLLYDKTGKSNEEIKSESYYKNVWGLGDNWYLTQG